MLWKNILSLTDLFEFCNQIMSLLAEPDCMLRRKFSIFFQDTGPRALHYHYHAFFWNPTSNGTQTFHKVLGFVRLYVGYFTKRLASHKVVWKMWDNPLCSFWPSLVFAWNSSVDTIFVFLIVESLPSQVWLFESTVFCWKGFGMLVIPVKAHHCFIMWLTTQSVSVEFESLRNDFLD